jgi:hypothetical protein
LPAEQQLGHSGKDVDGNHQADVGEYGGLQS